jgi:hypothetical protein
MDAPERLVDAYECLNVTEAYKRLDGFIFPCFRTEPTSQDILLDMEALFSTDVTIDEFPFDEIKHHLSSVKFVVGYADVSTTTPTTSFTAFFVSPTVLVTARHNLYHTPKGTQEHKPLVRFGFAPVDSMSLPPSVTLLYHYF